MKSIGDRYLHELPTSCSTRRGHHGVRPVALGLLLAVAMAALPSSSFAQASNKKDAVQPVVKGEPIVVTNHSNLRMDDGLSGDKVNVVFRDSEGLMWFGTDEGLNSYDGYHVRTFTPTARDTTSIGGKRVCDICEFTPGKLTLAMADCGLNLYDKRKDIFVRSPYSSKTSSDYGSALGLCRQADNAYAVFPSFVAKRNLSSTTEPSHFIDRQTKGILSSGGSGRVKMCTLPGMGGQIPILLGPRLMGILDTKYENITEVPFTHGRIYDITPFDAEHVLLATSDGVYRLNIKDKSIGPLELLGMLKGQPVQAILRTAEKNVYWVAYGGNKLLKLDVYQRTYSHVVGIESLLNTQTHINDIYYDDNGLLWLATSNVGVLKIDTKTPKIKTTYIDDELPDGCSTEDISTNDGKTLWAACGSDGLVKVDLASRTSTVIPMKDGVDATCVLVRKNSGAVLIGSSVGLWRYIPGVNVAPELMSFNGGDSSLVVRSLCEDNLLNAWVSTDEGLYRFNGAEFTKMSTVEGDLHSVNIVRSDNDGSIWAGTSSGLYVQGVGEKTFKAVGKQWSGREFEGVLSIAEYKQRMIVGTSSGVYVYDRRTLEPVNLPIFSKFENRSIVSVVCDGSDIVWLSTNSDISRVDLNYGTVNTFGHRDGLGNHGDECRKLDICKDVIYFGHVSAINSINTRNVLLNERTSPTFVSDVIYGASGEESLMPMENDSTYSHLYTLSATIKVHIASSDYTDPSRNNFKYSLNDGEWQLFSGTNEILISGLLPGVYKVRLKSSNADNIWGDSDKTFYIRLKSPLWLSRPAIIFYAIWLMSIIWLILNFRFRSINKRMRLAEAEAKSKTLVEDQRNRLVHAINEQHASLNYAKRIQDALMPKVDTVEQFFSKFFVFYRPKEIVSGDFYTFYHRDDKTFVISADCTGHGVPGAFISILGMDHLSNIIMRQKVDDAGEILTRLQNELRTKIGSAEINDGMDITICVVHHKEKKINFAGAMNDLYLIRNNEVTVYHGDRTSIGANIIARSDDSKAFSSQTLDGQSGDILYLFSDGYCDQFGGPEHKKFKPRRFKNLLLNIHKLPSNDQRQLLGQRLIEWMGNVEQTDDISIVGFEPWA